MKLNSLQKIQLLILSLLISSNCCSQDVRVIPKNRIGVTIRAEFVKDEFIAYPYIASDLSSGLGMELGLYYERKFLKRFVFLTEINLRYREFTKDYSKSVPFSLGNGVRLYSTYAMDWKLLTLTPSVGVRLYFYKKHKMYVEVGGGIDYRLNAAPSQEYIITGVYSNLELVDKLYLPSERIRESDLVVLHNRVYIRSELGLGMEIDKMDVGLFYRKDISESIGIRLRYSFLDK